MKLRSISSTLLIFLFAGLVLSLAKGKDKWINYTSDRGGFRAEFPVRPDLSESDLEKGKSYKAQAKQGETLYFLVWSVFNGEIKVDAYEAARQGLEKFSSSTSSTIKSHKDWKIKGNRGQEARLFASGSRTDFWYKTVLIGNKLYQIGVAQKGSIADEKKAKRFFKSFKLM